jgi:hypothetical protein
MRQSDWPLGRVLMLRREHELTIPTCQIRVDRHFGDVLARILIRRLLFSGCRAG